MPPKRDATDVVFPLAFIIAPWLMFAVALMPPFSLAGALPLMIFAVIFEAVGLWQGHYALYSLFGVDRLYVRDRCLVFEHVLFGRSLYAVTYDLSQVANVRLDTMSPGRRWAWQWSTHPTMREGHGLGPIVFDYQGQVVRLGDGLQGKDAFASDVVEMLRRAVLA